MNNWIEFDNKLIWIEPGARISLYQIELSVWALELTIDDKHTPFYWRFPSQEEAQKAYDKLRSQLLSEAVLKVVTTAGPILNEPGLIDFENLEFKNK